jgi:hypothetical protein
MSHIVNFYEVLPNEKKSIVEYNKSNTSTLQIPDYSEWKKGYFPGLPMAPDLFQGCLFNQYMNNSKFKIQANGGIIRCAIYGKPSDIFTGICSNFKGYIVLTNVSNKDFYVDNYTKLGLLIFGYCRFTHLSPNFSTKF